MKNSFLTLLAAIAALAFVVSSGNAEDEKPKKKEVTTVKCPVAGKEIKIADAKIVSYKNANVYVCCDACKGKMEKDSSSFATKANHQLVVTKQYRQVKCPLSGGAIDKDQKTKVEGVMVKFCCDKCKGKTDTAKGDEQIAMIFGTEAFDKGFEEAKKKE